ncbi:MAG: TIGR03364 family FAD-dependent oxidoreductase [Cyclobacteriaceae bacterium]
MKKYDLIVVGGGILGTFHAYHALKNGLSVALIEKDNYPQGATVRNFGQVVPSGMNAKWQTIGRRSLEIYKELQAVTDISVRQNGTIYLASNEEEMCLIEELAAINRDNGYTSKLEAPADCMTRYPRLKSSYVKGGLFFPDEVTVEPRLAVHQVRSYLIEKYQLDYFGGHLVKEIEENSGGCSVTPVSGAQYHSAKVIVCTGSDFQHIYPQLYAESDLVVTKLQMMLTAPQKNLHLPGSILTGLSIRRYESFTECPSYAAIKEKEPQDALSKKWGIHILFKQATDGSIILGDSHSYADAGKAYELGFDIDQAINDYMIALAKEIFELPTWDIQTTWFGIYSQCKTQDIFESTIGTNIHIVTGIGGKGMTGSPGYAEQSIRRIFGLDER